MLNYQRVDNLQAESDSLPIEAQALFVVPQVGKTGEAGDRVRIPPRSLDGKMPEINELNGGGFDSHGLLVIVPIGSMYAIYGNMLPYMAYMDPMG